MDRLYVKTFSRVRQSGIALAWIYGALFLAWLGLRSLFFDRLWWLALLNAEAFYWFVPLLVLLPFAAWQRCWRLVSVMSIILAVFLSWYGDQFLPAWPQTAHGPAIKVMSFSLSANQNYAAIAQRISVSAPDLVGLQEVSPAAVQDLMHRLSSVYPYVAVHPSTQSDRIALLSRFPIQSAAPLTGQPSERILAAKVQVNQRPLSVYVARLTPNRLLDAPLTELKQRTEAAFRERHSEIIRLRQSIRQSATTSIILCDCSLTDTSTAYATLNETLSDSFHEAGWGLGHMVSRLSLPFPAQRVDYVWHTPNLAAQQAHLDPLAGTEHQPILAQLRWVQ